MMNVHTQFNKSDRPKLTAAEKLKVKDLKKKGLANGLLHHHLRDGESPSHIRDISDDITLVDN